MKENIYSLLMKAGGVLFIAAALLILILPLTEAKNAPSSINYTSTTNGAITVLNELNAQMPNLMEQFNRVESALRSTEQAACLQTVVVAQLKYKDTVSSSIPDSEKQIELERLHAVASEARNSCPLLFQ